MKKVLITGTSRGIGKVIVNYFLEKDYQVILTYHNSINKINHKNVDNYYLDLSNEQSIIDLANNIKNKYGHIDILINNAAISRDNYYLDKTKQEFMEVLETNLVGTFLMIKYFDNIVNGYIFNISSTDGIDTGSIYSLDYNASKAGINIITQNIAMVSNNKIISICPNWVDVDSTKKMDQEYLKEELKRIKQDKLIDPITIPKVIDKCINDNIKSGSIIRIDGDINE